MEAKIRLENITHSFKETGLVLNGISLHVNDGEFVSIIGPSGSGKSTIFQTIGGLLKPEGGDIFLEGRRINGETGNISYMPQQASLLPWRTVLNNVLLAQELAGRTDESEVRTWLAKVGLSGYENAYPHQLSGGMKQRVAFIRALLSPQPIMLLDEPFSALDEFTRFDMQKWLLAIWEEKRKSVLFITHNIEEALFLSDRIVLLSPRPAKVIKEFKVPLNRPRTDRLLLDDSFLQLKREIYGAMKEGETHESH
ncbi:ABC transporter ATP-binding protein [Neobacillus piezotolerans]|uniref:ABC transporter ATP-binding protein n=1 Tax=Neobacillus piezotolerans TaxID=2259171 RepID=A0A3D8GUI1_9BACI|nr:ABC transporter ATP-binding protein [Neobacillus piezotolerans]RDU38022.1 ABC transporter ATP-binding protein [Neobacillus piezotolerans]